MNTQTAATTAHVTTRTIQAWCRYGAVTATKVAGRWDINPDSLAHRINLGPHRTPEATAVTSIRGTLIACGPASALAAAFAADQPVRIVSGKYAGDTIHLGLRRTTYGDYGITLETKGLMAEYGDGDAGYAIDTTRLGNAPALASALAAQEARTAAAEARRRRADDDYLNPTYQ